MTDVWIDLTTPGSACETAFNPASMKYRHRRLPFVQSADPSIIVVLATRIGEWVDGKPPSPPA